MKWIFLGHLPCAGYFPRCCLFKSPKQSSEAPLRYTCFAGKVTEDISYKLRAAEFFTFSLETELAWFSLSQEGEAEKALPVLNPPPLSLLSLNLSTRPPSLSVTGNIYLDNQTSQEPIITRSFNQLMPIQLLLNLHWL